MIVKGTAEVMVLSVRRTGLQVYQFTRRELMVYRQMVYDWYCVFGSCLVSVQVCLLFSESLRVERTGLLVYLFARRELIAYRQTVYDWYCAFGSCLVSVRVCLTFDESRVCVFFFLSKFFFVALG